MAPIVQTFEADFTQYAAAVKGAEAQLKSFVVEGDKVAAQLGRMTDQFSGARVIQQATLMAEAVERVGGASKLTTTELARLAPTVNEAVLKMEKMGVQVPDNLQKIAEQTKNITKSTGLMGDAFATVGRMAAGYFTIDGLMRFSNAVIDTADRVQTLAQRTGMSYEEVQKLDHIAGQTGTSMETLAGAAQTLTERLGKGDEGAAGALADLNINLAAFEKLGTYEQLLAINDGLRGVTDQGDKARIAHELLGNAWKELTPAMLANMREIGTGAHAMADEAVDAAARMKTAWKEAVEYAMQAGGEIIAWVERNKTKPEEQTKKNIEAMAAHLGMSVEASFGAAMSAIPPLAAKVVDTGFKPIKLSVDDVKRAEQELSDQFKAHNPLYDESLAKIKAYWDGIAKLIEKLQGNEAVGAAQQWADALAGISGNLTTLTQSDLKAAATAFDSALEAMARQGNGASELALTYQTLREQIGAALAQFTDVGPQLDQTLLDAEKAAAEAAEAERKYTQALYDAAVAEDKAAIAAAQHADELKKKTEETKKAEQAARSLATYTMGSSASVGDLAEQAARTGGQIAVDSYGNKYVWVPGKNAPPPGRAAGGPVEAGRSYVVGEKGPELFLPGTSGAILPNGAGATIQNVFNIVDTEANIVRRVSEAITRSITQARRV